MTGVCGFDLDSAMRIAENEGFAVSTVEVRSKKGVADGDCKRVIRVRTDEAQKTVELTFAVFKTTI